MQHLLAIVLAHGRLARAEPGHAAGDAHGRPVRLAGVVLVRQRPGNGNALFITLEDETGVANIVIWARLFDVFRRPVMAARLMLVEGEVQRSPEGVVHLMATRIIDRSASLDLLSETHDAIPSTARASETLAEETPNRARHPRDMRILPRSRDFH
jgi:error-prone DNA polymerase